MRVVTLTTVHPRHDTRVFTREANSIGQLANVELEIVVADGLGHETRENYHIHDIGRPRGGRLTRFSLTYLRALKYVRSQRPDVLHIHDPELLPLAAFLGTRGSRTIYDAHENLPKDIMDKHWIPLVLRRPVSILASKIELFLANRVSHVIVATSDIAERFSPLPTVKIQNFPKVSEFDFAARPDKKARLNVLYLGSITAVRGVPQIVDAMARLKDDRVCLVLAGPASPPELLEQLQAKPGWSRVDYRGVISRDELAELHEGIAAGLVTFLPAHNHLESQPNKLFEYMAAGIPIIASDFPAWRRLLEPIGNAIFVNPEEPQAIADAIERITASAEESSTMGERGRRAVLADYNWTSQERKLVDLYRAD